MPRLQDVADRLYRLVVNEANADAYRSDMGMLLNLSAEHQLGEGGSRLPTTRRPTSRSCSAPRGRKAAGGNS